MIRVRFAPSPTGLLHIGNARAALINWLLMRHHQLKGEQAHFLLRQDDTDLERSKPEFADAIKEDLNWLGISHDSFVKQSDRFDRYGELMEKLIKAGRLYPCYETPEELNFKRKQQMGRGQPPIYDRAALSLTADQKASYEKEGLRPHWRFLLEDKEIKWCDLIRGETSFQGNHLSDPVLVRADGAFLYTITSVIDDIDFDITHIIRGEDHVTNTAVQLQLFEALGGIMNHSPQDLHFAHTTLLHDQDGGPLSKRLGSLSLRSLREAGIDPMAVNSLLAHLGTSRSVEMKLTLDELAGDFDLSIFSRTPPRFDMNDLEALTRKGYQLLTYESAQERLKKIGVTQISEQLWQLIKGNIKQLDEAKQWESVCSGHIKRNDLDSDYLRIALDCLPDGSWDEHTWGQWTGMLKEKTGRKGKELFMPLRQAITGFDHGPEMKDLILLIGREKILRRLKGQDDAS